MTGTVNPAEHDMRVLGKSPEQLAHAVARSLREFVGADGEDRDRASAVLFQASGTTIAEMLEDLITDLVEVMSSAPTRMVDAELSHVMKTEDGWRAWGYAWFGKEQAGEYSLALGHPPRVSTVEGGNLELRTTILTTAHQHPRGTGIKATDQR